MRKLYQSTWNHEKLFADTSSKDEQFLIRPLLHNTNNTNMAGGWKLKFTFHFMEITHEPLQLDKLRFVQWEIMDILTSFIWTIIFFHGAFEYGGGPKFWGYVGTDAELFCVEFCNFGNVMHL
jgi:hypothetical protein